MKQTNTEQVTEESQKSKLFIKNDHKRITGYSFLIEIKPSFSVLSVRNIPIIQLLNGPTNRLTTLFRRQSKVLT